MKQLQTQDVAQISTPEVRCLPDAVVVDRMLIRDRTAVDYFASLPEERRPNVALDAFTIGTRALSAAGGSATMAALDEHLQSAVKSAAQNLAAVPTAINQQIEMICGQYLGTDGAFAQRLGHELQQLESSLRPDGKIISEINGALGTEVRRRVAEALSPVFQALNVNDEAGPLGVLDRKIQSLLSGQIELREQVQGAIRLHAQRDLSVHKGYDLEDFIENVIGTLTSRLGDRFENCSRVTGFVAGSKEGDFLATADPAVCGNADVRIALEAKNGKSHTVAALCRLLDSVKENRAATVTIGILTNPSISTRPIAMYGRDKVLVHLPGFATGDTDLEHEAALLEMAYYIARTQGVALTRLDLGGVIDTAFFAQYLDRIDNTVADFRTLNRNLSAIESAVTKTRETADNMRDRLKELAADLRGTLEEQTAIGDGANA